MFDFIYIVRSKDFFRRSSVRHCFFCAIVSAVGGLFFPGCANQKDDFVPVRRPNGRFEAVKILREKSISLKQFMTEEQVLELLGNPSTTAIEPRGSKTPRPWTALVWRYDGELYGDKLGIDFEKIDSVWRVSFWRWGPL